MNKNMLISVVTVVLVASGIVIWLLGRNTNLDTSSSTNNVSSSRVAEDTTSNASEAETKQSTTTPDSDTGASTSSSNSSASSTTASSDTNAKKATAITYSSGQFSPASVTIPVGASVTFANSDSSISVNIASDPHPSHTNFLSLNLGLLAPGKTSSEVKFDKVGTYSFHNHDNTSQTGKITVQ